jgi:hypothetical protein
VEIDIDGNPIFVVIIVFSMVLFVVLEITLGFTELLLDKFPRAV